MKAGDEAERRRLAAARGAEQHHELALRQVERDVRDRRVLAVVLAHRFEAQPGHRCTTWLSRTKRVGGWRGCRRR